MIQQLFYEENTFLKWSITIFIILTKFEMLYIQVAAHINIYFQEQKLGLG